MFKLISTTLIACAAFAFSTQAATITLDFDAASDGEIISDGTSSNPAYSGIGITALNTGGGPNLAVAYDSEGAIGRDSDLEENRYASKFTNAGTGTTGHTGFGNVLVVQENSWGCSDGVCNYADDEAGGGALRFAFEDEYQVKSFDYFDIDGIPDQQAETIIVKLFTDPNFDWSDAVNGSDVFLVDGVLSTGGDNTYRTHVLTNNQFVYGIEFVFSSSGAIDNIVLETASNTSDPIPAPAMFPVFLAGFAAMRVLGRRKFSPPV
ncbi:MAG: hypothetical protein ACPGRZ_12970 [Alphaproteobacteria bacterium]